MKANLKPATAKARELLEKLQALAERGIDGERISAQLKIARLMARFDFSGEKVEATPDLFQGTFKRAAKTRLVYTFGANDFDVANSVKWAIESATKIPCAWRNGDLMAEATPPTAARLAEIASHLAGSFGALLEQFSAVAGVSTEDRRVFVMGLYDGMMNEAREVGQRLPSRIVPKRTRKSKRDRQEAPAAPGLNIHPYTVGVSLGKQIRFSVPLEQIAAELEAVVQKHLAQPAEE